MKYVSSSLPVRTGFGRTGVACELAVADHPDPIGRALADAAPEPTPLVLVAAAVPTTLEADFDRISTSLTTA